MHKTLYVISWYLLSFALAQNSKLDSELVLIQLNHYYLLNSYPLAPFMSSEGRIMVPLKPIADLLDAEVLLYRRARAADVTRSNIKLHFTSGEYHALLNNEAIALDSPAYWDEQGDDLMVSIRVLLEAFDMPFEWHDDSRLLQVKDNTILQDENITHTFELMLGPFTDVAELMPQQIQFVSGITDLGENSLVMTVRLPIPTALTLNDKVSLYTVGLLRGQGGLPIFGLDLPTTQPILENPCTISNRFFNCVINYGSQLPGYEFRYLLARVGYKSISQ